MIHHDLCLDPYINEAYHGIYEQPLSLAMWASTMTSWGSSGNMRLTLTRTPTLILMLPPLTPAGSLTRSGWTTPNTWSTPHLSGIKIFFKKLFCIKWTDPQNISLQPLLFSGPSTFLMPQPQFTMRSTEDLVWRTSLCVLTIGLIPR